MDVPWSLAGIEIDGPEWERDRFQKLQQLHLRSGWKILKQAIAKRMGQVALLPWITSQGMAAGDNEGFLRADLRLPRTSDFLCAIWHLGSFLPVPAAQS